MNVLFICSRNQWRSRTAETIFKNHPFHQIRSAGTENGARIRANFSMMEWADLIFVMEKKHKQRLNELFPDAVRHKKMIVLEIPDEYQYMDADLIEMIKVGVEGYL